MRTRRISYFLTATLVLLFFTFSAQGEGRPFITRWNAEAGKQLRIPIVGENYKLVIKKADGTVLKTEPSLTIESRSYTPYYAYVPSVDGEIIVEAGPDGVEAMKMSAEHGKTMYGSASQLLVVEQFGTVAWKRMYNTFYNCRNMKFASNIDIPNLQHVKDMEATFGNCASFNSDISNWDVSNVTYMGYIFEGCTSFDQDLGNWKLEKCSRLTLEDCGMSVENYSKSLVGWAAQSNINPNLVLLARGMKYNDAGKEAREKLINDKQWDIRNDRYFTAPEKPFITRWKAEAGKELKFPIMGKNYKLVIKRASDGTVLKTAQSVTYNGWGGGESYVPDENGELLVEAGPTGVWGIEIGRLESEIKENLLKVEQFGTVAWKDWEYAFNGCKNMQFATGIDVPDLSNVDRLQLTFEGCTVFNSDISNWDVRNVQSMWHIFDGCTSFNQNLGNWKLEKCSNLVLEGCGMSVENYSKSLEGWAAQPNINSKLVLRARGLKYNDDGKVAREKLINEKQWDIRSDRYYAAPEKPFITRWKGEAGRELRIPIEGKKYKLVIKKVDGTVLKTEPSVSIGRWQGKSFYAYIPSEDGELLIEAGPVGVTSIDMAYGTPKNLLRVEQFGTVAWSSMGRAFKDCENLQFAPGIDSPDLFDAESMNEMFSGCTAFNADISNWDVHNVKGMRKMFLGCTVFNADITGWDVRNVYGMEDIFKDCRSFNHNLGKWKIESCGRFGMPNCGLSVENYSKTLAGWAAQEKIKPCFIGEMRFWLDATGLKYNKEGRIARKKLREEKGWGIFGDEATETHYIEFVQNKFTINKDQQLVLVLNKKGLEENETVTLVSDNPTTVQVLDDATLTVKGLIEGTATITATIAANAQHESLTATCKVIVTVGATVPTTGVSLSQTKLSLAKGGTATLTATVAPPDAANKNVTWSSNNTEVATVEDGTVTAVSGGKATITVTTEDGGHTATCEVSVIIPVTGVSLSQTELSLAKGGTATLTATVAPPDATNQNVTWSSNNTAVATVENGTVTAVSEGSATITVTTEDGSHTATCEVTVTIPVTGVSLSQTELSLSKGGTATLTATVAPPDATNQNVTWSSNNTEVATVEDGTVTAVSSGKATITVTTEDGGHTATCSVIVKRPDGSDPVDVTGVKLFPATLPLKQGTSHTLVASVEPANATNKAVTWSSDNDAVATVSDKGLVEAKTVGTATITVTTKDGGHTATCNVNVTAEDVVLTGLRISPSEVSVEANKEVTLSVSFEPVSATHKGVKWSSSDPTIATVDEHGKVKGIAEGKATITVISEKYETINNTCSVTVTPPAAVEDAVFANVTVSPNPFDTQLRISNGDVRGKYALYNTQGVEVASGVLEGAETRINTASFPAGMYLLRLTAENGATKTFTVVKR